MLMCLLVHLLVEQSFQPVNSLNAGLLGCEGTQSEEPFTPGSKTSTRNSDNLLVH
jgi:hypothetical protein